MLAWYDKAKTLAYGMLKLKPWELEKISVFEFNDMAEAYAEAQMIRRRETAYWVANIISPHLKHPAKTEELMKAFERPKTKEERAQEAESFFSNFARQREEAERG